MTERAIDLTDGECNMKNDLISRQAATSIPILPKEHRKIFKSIDDAFETGWNEALSCVNMLPTVQPEVCEGCKHLGKWENEVEYGYPSPCTRCKRRVGDHYER